MPIDPSAAALIDLMEATWPDVESMPAAEARRQVKELATAARGSGPAPAEVERVTDRDVPGPAGTIPVRIYWPALPAATTRSALVKPPLVVFFHGGGFVLCDLDTHDETCRKLANDAGAVVVSVDYRLAPEHRFPAGAEDAYAATVWAVDHAGELGADGSRVAVAGDSAGGNLAAVVSLMSRDRGRPDLRFQLLIYPVCDISPTRHDFGSQSDNATGYFLTTRDMDWFRAQYLPEGDDGSDPYASPLRATDLAGLPPALVITAEFDPLRDEGEAYDRRLQAAGVASVGRRYDGMFHGFFGMGAFLDSARRAHDDAVAALRRALA